MARINLLPWRENLRQERQRNFMYALAGTAVAAVLLVFLGSYMVGRQINAQEDRNQYLRTEIRSIERDIQQIERLEETRDNLLARKNVIEQLQENRSMMVHLFNYLARTVPDGLRLTSVHQRGEDLILEGRSQSETRVSDYMRNIEAAEWMHDPRLTIIEATDEEDIQAQPFEFELRTRVASPRAAEDSDDAVENSGEES